LEVGLGGRLDAVNAVAPDAAVLTNVALDHQRWLGDTLADIGREKAAIFRAGKPAVIGMPAPPAVVPEYAAAVGARQLAAGVDYTWSRHGDTWQWQCGDTVRAGLPLLDAAQTQNASAVLATLAALDQLEPLTSAQLAEIVVTRPPGRLELRSGAPTILLDVCHNEDAVGRLRDWLVQNGARYRRVSIVFGAMRDKAVGDMVALLTPHAERWFAVSAGGQRALPAEALARAMAPVVGRPVLAAGTPWQGFDAARARQDEADLVIACGSFPVVGQIRARL
ncbi:MAG: bifunctional tetrahydrofolate synthase/dihydrofolate synthase, partial [Pseudomonadota bacterium]